MLTAIGGGIVGGFAGYAALTKVAFEIERLARVEIRCDPKNVHSAAIPHKLRFQHEATLKERFQAVEGGLRDTMIWTLFARDYPGSPAAATELTAYDAAGRRLS